MNNEKKEFLFYFVKIGNSSNNDQVSQGMPVLLCIETHKQISCQPQNGDAQKILVVDSSVSVHTLISYSEFFERKKKPATLVNYSTQIFKHTFHGWNGRTKLCATREISHHFHSIATIAIAMALIRVALRSVICLFREFIVRVTTCLY